MHPHSAAGWLTREEAGSTLKEIQGVRVERTRSARRDSVPCSGPRLETTHARPPLFHQWATEEAEATGGGRR